MQNPTLDAIGYYAKASAITDPSYFAPLLDAVSKGIPAAVKAVQGLFVQVNWAEQYGLKLSDEREQEMRHARWCRSWTRRWATTAGRSRKGGS